MPVKTQPELAAMPIPGLAHATWAGRDDGLEQLSVWRQRLQPGAATPPHRHDCDEVVMCLAGRGELHADGAVQAFAAQQTLILPRQRMHQIIATGHEPLEIVGVFAATPVATRSEDGTLLELPWRS